MYAKVTKELEVTIAGNSVGIDYHNVELQVSVQGPEGVRLSNRGIGNDVLLLAEHVKRYGAVGSVALEACTGSAEFADELARLTGWKVKLCHPGYVRRMKSNPDKTDWSDANLISDLNRVGYLPEVWLAPSRIRDLRALVRYREWQVKRGRDLKLRIRSLLRQYRAKPPEGVRLWTIKGRDWLGALQGLAEHADWVLEKSLRGLSQVEAELKICQERLEQIASGDRLQQDLMRQKGIGLCTAAVIAAEIGTFSRFRTGKQLARFCGLSPRNASSGERQADAGLIKAGNRSLKTAIMEAAHRLIQHDQHWKDFAKRLLAAGKPYCVTIAAVANRWVRKLFYEMRKLELAAA